jgi:hypothetical protein
MAATGMRLGLGPNLSFICCDGRSNLTVLLR